MKIKTKKILFIFLIPALLGSVCFGCRFNPWGGTKNLPPKTVTLTFWGIFTEKEHWAPIIQAFQNQFPNIKIEYQNFGTDYDRYHNEIFNALATGKGPDIWTAHHTWLLRDFNLIQPAPPGMLDLNLYKSVFVGAVAQDHIIDGQIYGMPMSVDTLGLYYNKDLFNQAHIINPPQNWEEFKDDVTKLSKQDAKGSIIQAGAALGTGENINRAADILALLIMQNGGELTDPSRSFATLTTTKIDAAGNAYSPAEEALAFYTEFASPKKSVYTWNPLMHYSIDAFIEGNLAMMFSYAYNVPTVKLKAPNLDFKVSTLPQIAGGREVNYANYWTNVVSAKTPYTQEAWTFLIFAGQKENVQQYCMTTRRPPSRQDLFTMFDGDPELEPFAHQILTAKTWIRKDNDAADAIFEEMVENIILGKKSIPEALIDAEAKINQTMQ